VLEIGNSTGNYDVNKSVKKVKRHMSKDSTRIDKNGGSEGGARSFELWRAFSAAVIRRPS
jgi:hypothetical protein